MMQVEIKDGDILVDGVLLGGLLGVAAEDVPALLRTGAITSVCEQGIDAHQGQYRLSFFYKSRRARLSVDGEGRILQRSLVDFGEHALPRAARRPR
jgi:hypothetical protein